MSGGDLQSREEDAEAFLQAMTPQLMNSNFNTAILGQSNGVGAQKKAGADDNQKAWKSLEANLKVLQKSPTRSVSYKAKANSSGVASSAFQIEKAQSFKAKTVNTTSTLGEKYKKVDITTVGDNTKEKAVSGIESVLDRHTDGHFKQTIEDEKMLIKKGPAVNGGASPLRASERKQESNKASTIPSKPGPPPVASIAVKQEKTITSGGQKPPSAQQPIISNGKITETVKPNNAAPAVHIPSKPAPPAAQIPGKPAPPGAKTVAKSPSKPVAPAEVKSSPIKSTSDVSKPVNAGNAVTLKQSSSNDETTATQAPKPPSSSTNKTDTVQVTKPVCPDLTPKTVLAKVNDSDAHKVTTPSAIVKTQADNKVIKPDQSPIDKASAPQKTETAKPQPVVNAVTKPVQPVVNAVTKPVQPVVNATTKPVQPVVNATTKPVQPVVNATTKPVQPVNQASSAASTKPTSESPTVTSQTPVTTEAKDVKVVPKPSPAAVSESVKPAAVTSGNNVNSKVSSFNNNKVTNKCEPTVAKTEVPVAANFSQSKASIEKQFGKDKEPTTSKASEPIKIKSAGNFSQNKALLEKQLKTSENGEKNGVTQKTTPPVKPAANFSQNKSLLEKQLNAASTSGKRTPPNEATDGVPNEPSPVSDDDGPTDPPMPPPPPPPPPPVGGGGPPPPPGGPPPPPPPGGAPPPPPPPPPVGFVVKKSCISDSTSRSSNSGAKKPLVPQDDASVAFLAELKKRTNKVKGTENTADSS